jgi:hypothetical protein
MQKEKMKKVKKFYIDPLDLKKEIVDWKEVGKISERLGELFLLISKNMSYNQKFIGYSNHWKEEMIQQGTLFLCKYAKNFDPDHPKSNVFSYCSQIVYNAFIQFIVKEKKQSEIKNNLIELYNG